MRRLILLLLCVAGPGVADAPIPQTRPVPRPTLTVPDPIPVTRWDHRSESDRWARSAFRALRGHGAPLVETIPDDIARWCPGYSSGTKTTRRAFWVGLLSAMAKYESTYRPGAVGGGGRYFGLMQISPATARAHGCRATNGPDLLVGGDNLSCAIRIIARSVPRDGVIAAGGGGVASDWGPMTKAGMRAEMRAWIARQPYCQITRSPRPAPRPVRIAAARSSDALRPARREDRP